LAEGGKFPVTLW